MNEKRTAEDAVELFERWLLTSVEGYKLLGRARQAPKGKHGGLRGLDLACYCEIGTPCHRDVWIRLVNLPYMPEKCCWLCYRESDQESVIDVECETPGGLHCAPMDVHVHFGCVMDMDQ